MLREYYEIFLEQMGCAVIADELSVEGCYTATVTEVSVRVTGR
jgi:hypothetical protein